MYITIMHNSKIMKLKTFRRIQKKQETEDKIEEK